jgi:transcriptional regulator with GAF, ATPase, and Fis domain
LVSPPFRWIATRSCAWPPTTGPATSANCATLVERALILGYFPVDAFGSLTPPLALSGERTALDEVERQHILGVLAACNGNKSEAARQLGVSRKTIERKCAQWGVAGV